MRQKKKVRNSLKKKIESNEEKLHKFIKKKLNQNIKEQFNEDNKENKSYLININEHDKQKIKILTELNPKKEVISPSMSFKNYKSTYLKDKINKNASKNKKINNKNNYGKNNPLMKLDININNSTITPNNNSNKIKIDFNYKPNKFNNKFIYRPNRIFSKDKINNLGKYNESYIKDSIILDTLNNSIKKPVNLNEMLDRFEENQNKKKEKIDNLIKEKEAQEKKQYTYIPKINRKSKNINKRIKDDFITRQRRYSTIKSENEKKLKEKILKNEQEKINKSNFILQKKAKENSSVCSGLNASFISDISCRTRSMIDINTSISKLFEWDEKRKEKIKKMQKEKSNEIERNKHIPKINKKSKSMAHRNKNENIFERLAKEDEVVVAKKKIMEELLSPTFQPNLNITFRRYEEKDVVSRNKKYNKKRNTIENKEMNIIRIKVNRNKKIKPKLGANKDDNIIINENDKIEDEEVFDKFRKMIINNMNKQIRNKSLGKVCNGKYHI